MTLNSHVLTDGADLRLEDPEKEGLRTRRRGPWGGREGGLEDTEKGGLEDPEKGRLEDPEKGGLRTRRRG
ncbi:MAG: hypothetical protein ACLQK4_09425, partial [Acidimicrobiales bacterium]